jgi:hypothetical protein
MRRPPHWMLDRHGRLFLSACRGTWWTG